MFSDIAISLLKLMGHSGKIPSALYADDVPKALSALQAGLVKLAAQPKANNKNSNAYDKSYSNKDDDEKDEAVSLAKRALPLIEMLKAASQHKTNVMWNSQA